MIEPQNEDHLPDKAQGDEVVPTTSSWHWTSSESSDSLGSAFSDAAFTKAYEDINDTRRRNLGKVQDELAHTLTVPSLRCQLERIANFVFPRNGERWIRSSFANCFFGGMIIVNAIFLGFETDYNRPEVDDSKLSFWFIAESIFLLIFIMELLLRCQADKLLMVRDLWNIFDSLIVLLGVVDTWLLPLFFAGTSVSEMGRFTLFRLLRLVRIARVLRILRLLRFVRELLLLVQGILGALKALSWAFLLIVIVLYVSAILATEIIRDEFDLPAKGADEDLKQIEEWFGSVGSSLLTLLQLMTLEAWPAVVRETSLNHDKLWLLCFFMPFICCTNFALLNVVTAVMVEKVFKFAQDEKVMEAKKHLKERRAAMQKIAKLFMSLDGDNDGVLSITEIKTAIETKGAMKQFQDIGIAKHDIDGLFLCLDVDGKGVLSVAEFVEGCLRMHGAATSKDLLRIQYDVHRTRKALDIKKLTRHMIWSTWCLQNDAASHPSMQFRREARMKTDSIMDIVPHHRAQRTGEANHESRAWAATAPQEHPPEARGPRPASAPHAESAAAEDLTGPQAVSQRRSSARIADGVQPFTGADVARRCSTARRTNERMEPLVGAEDLAPAKARRRSLVPARCSVDHLEDTALQTRAHRRSSAPFCEPLESAAVPATVRRRSEIRARSVPPKLLRGLAALSEPGRQEPATGGAAPGSERLADRGAGGAAAGASGEAASAAGKPSASDAEAAEAGAGDEGQLIAALPHEAQDLLEEVLDEQQSMRRLLQVLGDEMRELRERVSQSSSLSLLVPFGTPRVSVGSSSACGQHSGLQEASTACS